MQRSDERPVQRTQPDPAPPPGRLVVVGEEECWALVRSRPVGRLAWQGSQGVTVVPVNFSVAGREILVRTTPYSLMARDCVDREVAFQVDTVDEDERSGWSVLLRGRCERAERLPEGDSPWVTGPRVLALRIAVQTVSGRRLLPAPPVG